MSSRVADLAERILNAIEDELGDAIVTRTRGEHAAAAIIPILIEAMAIDEALEEAIDCVDAAIWCHIGDRTLNDTEQQATLRPWHAVRDAARRSTTKP